MIATKVATLTVVVTTVTSVVYGKLDVETSVRKDVTKEVMVLVNKDSMVVMSSPSVSSARTELKRRQSNPSQQEKKQKHPRIEGVVMIQPRQGG